MSLDSTYTQLDRRATSTSNQRRQVFQCLLTERRSERTEFSALYKSKHWYSDILKSVLLSTNINLRFLARICFSEVVFDSIVTIQVRFTMIRLALIVQVFCFIFAPKLVYGASMNCSCNPGWHTPQNIYGVSIGKPAITSYELDSLNVFVRGTDDQLWARYYENGKWLGWVQHWGKLTSAPSATSPGMRKIYIAVRGSDAQFWVRHYNSNEWMGWESIGGNSTMDPAITSYGTDHVHVFVCSQDGKLHIRTKAEGSWNAWTPLDQSCISAPTAVMLNGKSFCVAVINDEKAVSIGKHDNEVWSWSTITIPTENVVSITTWDFNKLVIFTKNKSGMVLMTIFDTVDRTIDSVTEVTHGLKSAPSTTFVGYKKIALAGTNSAGETIITTMSAWPSSTNTNFWL